MIPMSYRYRWGGVATCSLRYSPWTSFPFCVCRSIALSSSAKRPPIEGHGDFPGSWWFRNFHRKIFEFLYSFQPQPFSLLSFFLALPSSSVGWAWLHASNTRDRVRRGLRICLAAGKYCGVCFLLPALNLFVPKGTQHDHTQQIKQ